MKIKELTAGFVDYENFGAKGGSFGSYDKGKELLFEIYPNDKHKPIRVRFFISFLQRMANTDVRLDEKKLFVDAKEILKSYDGKELGRDNLLYLYNFSTLEFDLLE